MNTNETKYTCSICGDVQRGYGNNAQPINNGRCCDTCNMTQVIPARLTGASKDQMTSTRTDLSDALTALIERADDQLCKQLFDALKAYKAFGQRERHILRQPVATFLIEALEEGLFEFFIEADEERVSR